MLDFYEPAYTMSPEAIMLMREEEDECSEGEVYALESQYRAGLARTAPKQSDREITGHHSEF